MFAVSNTPPLTSICSWSENYLPRTFETINILTNHKFFILTASWSCVRSITSEQWTVTSVQFLLSAILWDNTCNYTSYHGRPNLPDEYFWLRLIVLSQNSYYLSEMIQDQDPLCTEFYSHTWHYINNNNYLRVIFTHI